MTDTTNTTTDTDAYTPSHADDDKYTVEHPSGRETKVTVYDRKNGGQIGVYYYDPDGTRLDYHRFRINSLDDRAVVYEGDDAPLHDDIIRAIHVGGWDVKNLYQTTMPDFDTESRPMEFQLLDTRDAFEGHAKRCDTDYMAEFYTAVARLVELTLVSDFLAEQSGKDFAEEYEKFIGRINAGDRTLTDQIEGTFINAVRPETQRSTKHHDHIVRIVETARTIFDDTDADTDAERAFEQSVGLHGEPQ